MFGRICTTITKKINFNQKCLQFSTQSSNTWFLVANNNNAIVFYPLRKISKGFKICSVVSWYFCCIWIESCGGHATCYNQANRGTEIPSSIWSKFTIIDCRNEAKHENCIVFTALPLPCLHHFPNSCPMIVPGIVPVAVPFCMISSTGYWVSVWREGVLLEIICSQGHQFVKMFQILCFLGFPRQSFLAWAAWHLQTQSSKK